MMSAKKGPFICERQINGRKLGYCLKKDDNNATF